MDRVAVCIDAGYLFAAGSTLLAGKKLTRGNLDLNVSAVARFFKEFAEEETGLPLLRMYWYDGTSTGPTTQHQALAYTENIKVRLGFINPAGQQKGVDSLIVTDLILLARNRAAASALLLTGDEDTRVGVQQAQEFGMRVHLVGVEPHHRSQSNLLIQEADRVHELGRKDIDRFLSIRASVGVPVMSSIEGLDTSQVIEIVARAVLDDIEDSVRDSMFAGILRGEKTIPRDVDRALLTTLSKALKRPLTDEERKAVRHAFKGLLQRIHD